jgi:RNA 2',3'-cyclic 3'-phosphodiesterase
MAAERLFLAVDLAAEARDALAAAVEQAAPGELPGRPVPPRNWHITLRFLGDTAPPHRDELIAVLRERELGPAFHIELAGAGAFPRPRRAAALWIGVGTGHQDLARLASKVEEAARNAGFGPENRPFRGHITLARMRTQTDVERVTLALSQLAVTTRVTEVTLFRSELGSGPPRYLPVERFALRHVRSEKEREK